MQECWINVYQSGMGGPYYNHNAAINIGKLMTEAGEKCVYRIHVKMKPVVEPKRINDFIDVMSEAKAQIDNITGPAFRGIMDGYRSGY